MSVTVRRRVPRFDAGGTMSPSSALSGAIPDGGLSLQPGGPSQGSFTPGTYTAPSYNPATISDGFSATAQGLPRGTNKAGYTPGPETNQYGSWGGAATGGIQGTQSGTTQGSYTPGTYQRPGTAGNYGAYHVKTSAPTAGAPSANPNNIAGWGSNAYPVGSNYASGGPVRSFRRGGHVPAAQPDPNTYKPEGYISDVGLPVHNPNYHDPILAISEHYYNNPTISKDQPPAQEQQSVSAPRQQQQRGGGGQRQAQQANDNALMNNLMKQMHSGGGSGQAKGQSNSVGEDPNVAPDTNSPGAGSDTSQEPQEPTDAFGDTGASSSAGEPAQGGVPTDAFGDAGAPAPVGGDTPAGGDGSGGGGGGAVATGGTVPAKWGSLAAGGQVGGNNPRAGVQAAFSHARQMAGLNDQVFHQMAGQMAGGSTQSFDDGGTVSDDPLSGLYAEDSESDPGASFAGGGPVWGAEDVAAEAHGGGPGQEDLLAEDMPYKDTGPGQEDLKAEATGKADVGGFARGGAIPDDEEAS